jgi:hypothetical protein
MKIRGRSIQNKGDAIRDYNKVFWSDFESSVLGTNTKVIFWRYSNY